MAFHHFCTFAHCVTLRDVGTYLPESSKQQNPYQYAPRRGRVDSITACIVFLRWWLCYACDFLLLWITCSSDNCGNVYDLGRRSLLHILPYHPVDVYILEDEWYGLFQLCLRRLGSSIATYGLNWDVAWTLVLDLSKVVKGPWLHAGRSFPYTPMLLASMRVKPCAYAIRRARLWRNLCDNCDR